MNIVLTREETELIILAGLMADDSPYPLLKKDIEKATVEIKNDGVVIDIEYKTGREPELG